MAAPQWSMKLYCSDIVFRRYRHRPLCPDHIVVRENWDWPRQLNKGFEDMAMLFRHTVLGLDMVTTANV
jgi:hypothetical protein